MQCEWRTTVACRTFWTVPLAEEAARAVAALQAAEPKLGNKMSIVTDKEDLRNHHKVNGAPLATLTAGAASLWPYKLIAFILERAIKGGGLNLQTNTPVTKLEVTPSTESSARYNIHTSRGNIVANHVILATNAYTSHLLPEFSDLIVPARETMSALLPPKGATLLPNSYGFVGTHHVGPSADDYLNQRPFQGVPNPAGHLMFGGGRPAGKKETVGQDDDSVLDPGVAAYLRRELLDVLVLDGQTDGLVELEATHQWSGIIALSKDHRPWVGGVPGRKGVWLAGGYSGRLLLYRLVHQRPLMRRS